MFKRCYIEKHETEVKAPKPYETLNARWTHTTRAIVAADEYSYIISDIEGADDHILGWIWHSKSDKGKHVYSWEFKPLDKHGLSSASSKMYKTEKDLLRNFRRALARKGYKLDKEEEHA